MWRGCRRRGSGTRRLRHWPGLNRWPGPRARRRSGGSISCRSRAGIPSGFNARRVELLPAEAATASHPDGVLVIDDSGDRNDGKATAHVGRQWLGRLGKTDNGIVTVSTLWADERIYYPLHARPIISPWTKPPRCVLPRTRSRTRGESVTCTYADETGSAASFTSTHMPLDLHGCNFGRRIHHALMRLLGHRDWWLPRPLARPLALPRPAPPTPDPQPEPERVARSWRSPVERAHGRRRKGLPDCPLAPGGALSSGTAPASVAARPPVPPPVPAWPW
ncbi:transposase [Nonomuraea sp. NPDC048882]|uniref:transposase n=1 Tax=Nonomuraea sp. NPDC048882 TaxID=3154347 RepID=UPI0033DE3D16